eukprot:741343_1
MPSSCQVFCKASTFKLFEEITQSSRQPSNDCINIIITYFCKFCIGYSAYLFEKTIFIVLITSIKALFQLYPCCNVIYPIINTYTSIVSDPPFEQYHPQFLHVRYMTTT